MKLKRLARVVLVGAVGIVMVAGVANAQNVGIFLSAISSNGNLGGLSGADATCQAEGTAAIPGSGPWNAWISTDGSGPPPIENAMDRIATPGATFAYVRASAPATVIATSLSDLTDGMLDQAIGSLDAAGLPLFAFAWTGTSPDGTIGLPTDNGTCRNWTDGTTQGLEGTVGRAAMTDTEWTRAGSGFCDDASDASFFCVGFLPAPVAPTLPPFALALFAALLLAGGAYLYRRRQAAG